MGKTYRFQEGDLVINRFKNPDKYPNFDYKPYEIYARVIKVDRSKDILLLECYKSCGRLPVADLSGSPYCRYSLSDTERKGDYQLQSKEDLNTFYKGLAFRVNKCNTVYIYKGLGFGAGRIEISDNRRFLPFYETYEAVCKARIRKKDA